MTSPLVEAGLGSWLEGDGQQICDMPLRTTLKRADNWWCSKTNNENAQKEARSFKSHEKKPLEWVHAGFDKSGRSMWEATIEASYRQGLVIEKKKTPLSPSVLAVALTCSPCVHCLCARQLHNSLLSQMNRTQDTRLRECRLSETGLHRSFFKQLSFFFDQAFFCLIHLKVMPLWKHFLYISHIYGFYRNCCYCHTEKLQIKILWQQDIQKAITQFNLWKNGVIFLYKSYWGFLWRTKKEK